MKLNFAVFVFLLCANVSAQTFHGDWSSNQISVSSKVDGEFVNCKSDLSLSLTETHLTIGSPALIHCEGMTFVAESRPLAISEGGVLTSYSGARGTITDTKIEFVQPVYIPEEDTIVEAETVFKLNSATDMFVVHKLESKSVRVIIRGTFTR